MYLNNNTKKLPLFPFGPLVPRRPLYPVSPGNPILKYCNKLVNDF